MSQQLQRSMKLATMDFDAIKPVRNREDIPWELTNFPDSVGSWEVIEKPYKKKALTAYHWFVMAKCGCGAIQEVRAYSLWKKKSKQCGKCATKETARRYEEMARGGV